MKVRAIAAVVCGLMILTASPATAELTFHNHVEGQEVYVAIGGQRNRPFVYQDGRFLGSCSSCVWTSDNPTVATVDSKIRGVSLGEATVTVTYDGESSYIVALVRHGTSIGVPTRTVVGAGPLALTTQVTAGPLMSAHTGQPIAGAPATFTGAGSELICEAVTDAAGWASCTTLHQGDELDFLRVDVPGDDLHMPATNQNQQ